MKKCARCGHDKATHEDSKCIVHLCSCSGYGHLDAQIQTPFSPTSKGEQEAVHHPNHYGPKDDPYEVIKVLRAWGCYNNAPRFNSLKYLARAGKKGDLVQDLQKAAWYVFEEIAEEKRKRGEDTNVDA